MITHGTALFCEEIRQEINGKFILLGVFTGGMLVPSFPTTQRLASLVRLDVLSSGDHDFEFISSEGASFGKLTLELEADASAVPPVFIPLPPVVLTLSQSTTISLRFKKSGAEQWGELGSIGISVAPSPIPNMYVLEQ